MVLTQFAIQPYLAMLGALKISDVVEIRAVPMGRRPDLGVLSSSSFTRSVLSPLT